MNDPNEESEPFLARWSRRKREAVLRQPEPDGPDATMPAERPHEQDAQPKAELDLSRLPRVEDLTLDSDISVFLDRRVPAALRNAALGRMWTLDPTIRDFIEVAENQWNWNVPGGAPFYGPIEDGAGIGELVAQAAGGAARTGTMPPASVVNEKSPSSTMPEGSQGIDSSVPPTDAPQVDPQSEIAATRDRAAPRSVEETPGSPANVADAAMQHRAPEPQSMGSSTQRRHGGALPS